jgi:hypothetical protein
MKTDEVARVPEISARLTKLKERLVELDAERTAVRDEINTCMLALSSAMSDHYGDGYRITTRTKVMNVYLSDPTQRLTAADLSPMVQVENHATLRGLLRQMANEGLLVRLRRGLYALRR